MSNAERRQAPTQNEIANVYFQAAAELGLEYTILCDRIGAGEIHCGAQELLNHGRRVGGRHGRW